MMAKHHRDKDDDRKDKRKDKHKKKSHEKKKKKHKRSSREEEAPTVDHDQAITVTKNLLNDFPAIGSELLSLLQMLDDGQTAVIGGIENKSIKSYLKKLFPLLGLSKLKAPKGAYAKQSTEVKNTNLLELFQRLLSESASTKEKKPDVISAPEPAKRATPIGPTLPATVSEETKQVDLDDSDDETVGPALPGSEAQRLPDQAVEEEMAKKAEELKQQQWKKARGEKTGEELASSGAKREAWMTMMPEQDFLKDTLGGGNKPQPGKAASFRAKEAAQVDETWFESPEERERSNRAKLDMELLGYVRQENAPRKPSKPSLKSTKPSVNESIQPSANAKADEDMRRQMDQLRESRGPSLLEKYKQQQADDKKQGIKRPATSGWDRDRDLKVKKKMSKEEAEQILKSSQQISSKFAPPTISRQFL